MIINQLLFAINVIGVFLSLGFIVYEVRTDKKRWSEERRLFAGQQRLWQPEGARAATPEFDATAIPDGPLRSFESGTAGGAL